MASFTERARERGTVPLSFTERKRQRISEDKAEAAKRSKMGTTKNMTAETITKVEQPEPKEPTILQKFGNNLMAGVGRANKATVNAIESIGGDKVPLLNKGLDSIERGADNLISKGGSSIGAQVIQSIPNAASNMALAFMSGGASIAPQLGKNATIQAAKSMVTSPMFANSMLQSYGGAYGQARDEGANRPQAISKALIQAFPQAAIEQVGGIEQLPATMGKQSLLKTIGKSALEEAGEEILQYPFEGLARKATYAPNTPIFSTKENAIINPKEMGQSALVGGLAGGLMGGGAKAVSNISSGRGQVAPTIQENATEPKIEPMLRAEQQTVLNSAKQKEPWQMARAEYNKINNIDENEKINYHGTSKESKESILKNGFKDFGTGANITQDFETAREYADGYEDESGDVIEVRLRNGAKPRGEYGTIDEDSFEVNDVSVDHKEYIKQALSQGEIISKDILNDYPDLQIKAIGGQPTQQEFTPIGGKPETNIPKGEKLLSFPQTMENSDTTAPELKQMIKDNPLSHQPINNPDTLKYAQQIVDQDFEAAKRVVMEGESFSNATESAMAQDIIRRLQNERKWDDAFDVMEATARKAKTSGQAIQAFSMWRRMTPEGMLKYAHRVFDKTGMKMTGEFADKLTDSMKRIQEITDPKALQQQIINQGGKVPEWAQRHMDNKTIEQLQDIAMAQVLMDISNEMPKSAWRKASSIQAMSHLINIKTALRNILGNLSFSAVEKISNAVAVPVDVIASKFTGKRSLTTPQFKGTFKAGLDQATESAFDAALGIDRTGTSKGKYNVPIGGSFKKGSAGAFGEKIMKYELNVPDEFFKGQIYSDVLQQQMKVAGVAEPTADMIDYANARAKYTTFQDDSLPAKILQGLKDVLNLAGGGEFKKGKSGIKTHEFGLGDFLIKYTTVPGNLISRTLEYTPAGMAKIFTTANNAKLSAPTKQAEIAMVIGRSITGTALIGFATLLNRLGLLISEDKDRGKNAQALDQAEGLGNYKVNVTAVERMINGEDTTPQAGDSLQSYSWIEPLGTLIAIGAEVDKQIKKDDNTFASGAFNVGNAAMEEILDLPTLSVIRQMTYQDNAFDVLMTPLVQGVSGFVPGPIRQAAQMQDPVARLTKSDSQGGAILNRIQTSLPSVNIGGVDYGRKSLEPKINAWGQEVTYPGGLFNSLINPGQTSTYQPSEVTSQLKQLEDITGKTDFYPRFTAPYSFTHNKQPITLTPEEKTIYMRLEGEEVHKRFKEILANGVAEETAEKTIKALNKAKDKASSMARDEILKNRGLK